MTDTSETRLMDEAMGAPLAETRTLHQTRVRMVMETVNAIQGNSQVIDRTLLKLHLFKLARELTQ